MDPALTTGLGLSWLGYLCQPGPPRSPRLGVGARRGRPSRPAAGWSSRPSPRASTASTSPAPRARDPEGVKRFVQAARYPIHKQAIDTVGEGLRGWGSHTFGRLGLGPERPGVPPESRRLAPQPPKARSCSASSSKTSRPWDRAAETLSVPGLAFAEHGPRDLGLSYGHLEGRADPPLPPEVVAAGDMVLELTKERGMFFLDNVLPENVTEQLDRGVDDRSGPAGGLGGGGEGVQRADDALVELWPGKPSTPPKDRRP